MVKVLVIIALHVVRNNPDTIRSTNGTTCVMMSEYYMCHSSDADNMLSNKSCIVQRQLGRQIWFCYLDIVLQVKMLYKKEMLML